MASEKKNVWSLAGIIYYNLSTAADLLTLSIMFMMMFYSVCVCFTAYYDLFYFTLFKMYLGTIFQSGAKDGN